MRFRKRIKIFLGIEEDPLFKVLKFIKNGPRELRARTEIEEYIRKEKLLGGQSIPPSLNNHAEIYSRVGDSDMYGLNDRGNMYLDSMSLVPRRNKIITWLSILAIIISLASLAFHFTKGPTLIEEKVPIPKLGWNVGGDVDVNAEVNSNLFLPPEDIHIDNNGNAPAYNLRLDVSCKCCTLLQNSLEVIPYREDIKEALDETCLDRMDRKVYVNIGDCRTGSITDYAPNRFSADLGILEEGDNRQLRILLTKVGMNSALSVCPTNISEVQIKVSIGNGRTLEETIRIETMRVPGAAF